MRSYAQTSRSRSDIASCHAPIAPTGRPPRTRSGSGERITALVRRTRPAGRVHDLAIPPSTAPRRTSLARKFRADALSNHSIGVTTPGSEPGDGALPTSSKKRLGVKVDERRRSWRGKDAPNRRHLPFWSAAPQRPRRPFEESADSLSAYSPQNAHKRSTTINRVPPRTCLPPTPSLDRRYVSTMGDY